MTENERIRVLRNYLDLTLVKFGEVIGISNQAVSMIESGKNAVSNRTRSAIVREFGVSETWLRTGEGEMFRAKSRKEEMAEYAAKLVGGELDAFQTSLIAVLAKLDADQIALLADIAEKMAEEYKKEKADQ